VWVTLTTQPNVTLDVTETWPIRLQALLEHKTQVGEPEAFKERMRTRHTEDSTDEKPRYEEKFRVIKYGQYGQWLTVDGWRVATEVSDQQATFQ